MFGKFKRKREAHYNYVQGAKGFGVGADALALVRPHGMVLGGTYGPRYNVLNQPQIATQGSVVVAQSLPSVDLKADGVYLSGQMALQSLSNFEGEGE